MSKIPPTQKNDTKKQHFDIRVYKKNLRSKHRGLRRNIPNNEKVDMDSSIFKNICSIPEYTICTTVLCFVAFKDEIDTKRFITQCISDGKKVAVPYCIEESREMDFYYIDDLSQLAPRTYGVLEPVPEIHEKVTDFSDSICIVPGIAFDKAGYRVGYGGGYYDRFLSSKYNGLAKIGICYSESFIKRIIHGRYDISSDFIVTELGVKKRIVFHDKSSNYKNRKRHNFRK